MTAAGTGTAADTSGTDRDAVADGMPVGVVGPAMAEALPAHLRLLLLTDGKRISQVVHVLAELGIADQLADGPMTVADLAARCDAQADALTRVLRVASGFGVFAELPNGAWANSPLSAVLRTTAEDSQRDLVLFNGDEMLWRSYGALLHTVRTGRPAFEAVYGHGFFEHLREDPAAGRLFDRAMTQMSQVTTQLLLDQLDLSEARSVVDIGGGNGFFLAELLRLHPGLSGTLLDRPEVVIDASVRFGQAGVSDRTAVVGGDFFAQVPTGHDAYLLKAVLHDWDDGHAGRIIRNIRRAIGDNTQARLYIGEFVISTGNHWDRGRLLDLDMMLRFGGRLRTVPQWQRLLASAGFTLLDVPTPGRWSVLECQVIAA